MKGRESWTVKKAEYWRIDTFELWCWRRLLKESFGQQGVRLVNPKGNQIWIFSGRTDAEAEAPVLCPSYAKSQLIGKGPESGKDWGQEEKGTTEDEIVGWNHWIDEHRFEQTLVCCNPQGRRIGHDLATKSEQQQRTNALNIYITKMSWGSL